MSDSGSPTPLVATIEPFLQDKGKGRSSGGGNYRRNAGRELEYFLEWARGDQDDDWDGIVPPSEDREPTVDDLDEHTFRAYARHLSNGRHLKQNTVQTYYAYVSSWCGWCVREGYLDAHYAQRTSAKTLLPEDDGRRPGDQQAWSPEQRHQLTSYVDQQARDAIESVTTLDEDTDEEGRQRARYQAIKACRDRALVFVLAYTAVRVGEVLRDPNDPRRRGLRWDDLALEDGSMDVYRKKQSWDTASLPEPVIHPLEQYRSLVDPPSDRWPVFPMFGHSQLSSLVRRELSDRGLREQAIQEMREQYARDFLLALAEDIRPRSISTNSARRILKRLTDAAGIDVDDRKHSYLSPHGGRRGMGGTLVRAFGYTVAARYLDNSEEMVRKRYSHIEAGELGDLATEAINELE